MSKKNSEKEERNKKKDTRTKENKECFVIMPISTPKFEKYEENHFNHVYEKLLKPAIKEAGFKPIRSDDIKKSDLIVVDIINKLLESPMAVCDLSSHNPNVLYELALRQAFDNPIALVKERGEKDIFDISGIRYTEYDRNLYVYNVEEEIREIAISIKETFSEYKESTSNILQQLAINRAASIPESGVSADQALIRIVMDRLDRFEGILLSEDKEVSRDLIIAQDIISNLLNLIEIFESNYISKGSFEGFAIPIKTKLGFYERNLIDAISKEDPNSIVKYGVYFLDYLRRGAQKEFPKIFSYMFEKVYLVVDRYLKKNFPDKYPPKLKKGKLI